MFQEIPANKRSLANRKTLYGVGINDADYMVYAKINGRQVSCPFYTAWKHMIERCYSKKHHDRHPTYRDCTATKEWLTFSKFKKWMQAQDWHKKALDKDILIPGNRHYSPNTCVFITSQLNSLLNSHKKGRGKCPQGVSYHKRDRAYQAQCSVNGKVKSLGYYGTEKEAEQAYNKFKSILIVNVAQQQQDERIKAGLMAHAGMPT